MKRFVYSFLTLCMAALPGQALVGDWLSFSRIFKVRDLQAFKGDLWVATPGGIRRLPMDGGEETVYRNPDGLLDLSIQGLEATPGGDLWAVSESGLLYRLHSDRKRWEVFGASYKTAGWKMRKRAVFFRAPYLILGSDKGLSFFHVRTGSADANITRMGSEKSISVNSVTMVGDTLFVGTGKGIFRAVLQLDNLLGNTAVNIFNPDIWARIPGTESNLFHHPGPIQWRDSVAVDSVTGDTITVVVARRDSADLPATASQDSAHGVLYYTGDGIASEYEGAVAGDGSRIARYGRIHLADREHPNPFRLEVLERVGNRWFTGGSEGLLDYNPDIDGYAHRHSDQDLPPEDITMIKATPHGVYALGPPKAFKFNNGKWDTLPGYFRISDKVDANRNGSHPFDVLGKDELYVGTWGHGFYTYSNGKGNPFVGGEGNSCLEGAVANAPSYVVVISQARYRGRGLFLTTLHNGPFKLAFYDLATETVSCLPIDARDSYPLGLEVIGDLLVAVGEGGVSSFRIRERDGKVTVDPQNLTSTLRSPEPTKTGMPDFFGNLWVTTGSGKLFFVPELGGGKVDGLQFKSLDGFPGRECKSIDRDARGHIWVGCVSGGLVEITPGRDSLAHTFRRYGVNDGLISENVYHLSVDSASGHLWVVTEKGLARLETTSRPAARSLSAARVYPNPFLAKHSQVVFDGLADGSEIQILTQGGSILYSRRLLPTDGNQLRWDGRNLAGRKVTEGIYFYVIRSPKDLKRGKIIVGR